MHLKMHLKILIYALEYIFFLIYKFEEKLFILISLASD